MKEIITIFNDGSSGSKLLQSELKDEYEIHTLDVSGNLENWFKQITPENKIFLHLCYEEVNAGHIREILQGLESKGFRNKIVLPYEGLDKKTMEKRARQKGIGESKIGVSIEDGIKYATAKEDIKPNERLVSNEDGTVSAADRKEKRLELHDKMNEEINKVIHETSGYIGKEDKDETTKTTNKRKNKGRKLSNLW